MYKYGRSNMLQKNFSLVKNIFFNVRKLFFSCVHGCTRLHVKPAMFVCRLVCPSIDILHVFSAFAGAICIHAPAQMLD